MKKINPYIIERILMRNQLVIILLFFFLIPITSFAQESNCSDGIDNDGDGFIDCYDDNCLGTAECQGFFIVPDSVCSISPPTLNYEMKDVAGSSNRNVTTQARIVVGDVDNDGIPDIVTPHQWDSEIRVLWGGGASPGATKYSISTSPSGTEKFRPELEIAIAEINGDNCTEIFSFERKNSGGNKFFGNYYLASYNCDLSSNLYRVLIGSKRPGIIGLADFDGDGLTEVYYKNEIRAAEDGTVLVSGTGNWENDFNSGPVAIDILPDNPGLELVVGKFIYGVSLPSRTANSGSITKLKRMPLYKIKDMGPTNYSTTSVADFDLDGNLDVLATGATGNKDGPTAVFYWNVANNTVSTWETPDNWLWGTGRINIADNDNDGLMNANFASGNKLYSLELDGSGQLQLSWQKGITDSKSGIIGVTSFDFDNDQIMEVVYRDAGLLTIASGIDGTTLKSLICQSHTLNENPIIADVNGDGNTNICVPCNFSDNPSAFKINDGLQQQGNGNVRVYEASAGQTWVPTRKVWNQHGYHITNVNDDITIPRTQQSLTTVFSGTDCSSTTIQPLNGFINQTPTLNTNGCPTLPAADLNFLTSGSSSAITIIAPVCPQTDFLVSFKVQNIGDVSISSNLPVTFYKGDPTQAGAVKLKTETFIVTNLAPGDSIIVDSLSVTADGTFFELFVVLDDDGTTPVPITLPTNPSAQECDFTNNIESSLVNPQPFTLGLEKIQDNIICDASFPNTGAARAFALQGGSEITAGFTFNWFNGTTVTATPDYVGHTYSGIADGTYTVFAVKDGIGCTS
ncbi:MAG: hypothetical protein O6939_00570, partial [Bacteroidetes bacterium]|nr:hypothetical protein [Bacteroidota bacterium]